MMRVALLLLMAGCAPVTADLRPADIGPEPVMPAYPAIEPTACGDAVCLTPEDAIALGGWRDRVEAWGAEMVAWGGYFRAAAGAL